MKKLLLIVALLLGSCVCDKEAEDTVQNTTIVCDHDAGTCKDVVAEKKEDEKKVDGYIVVLVILLSFTIPMFFVTRSL